MACRLSAPSYFLNQCWNIVNWNLRIQQQCYLKQNAYIFIQENAFQNVIWEMVAILSRPQCFNYPSYPAACSVSMFENIYETSPQIFDTSWIKFWNVIQFNNWTCLAPVFWILLKHWGWVSHICVGKLTIIDSDNSLSPGRCQAIMWTNAGILLIGPLGTNFNEILINIQAFSFKKMHFKMSSVKWHPFCLDLNVLIFNF